MTILSIISAETSLPENYLRLVVRTADHRYKSYTVQKPSGGLRTILHPARELKFLQRWVASRVLVATDIHVAATAYHKGATIAFNAALHKQGAFFLKIDFQDFFPSITIDDVSALLRRLPSDLPEPLSDDDIEIIGKIVTRVGQLVIGAPSSPVIANAVMYDFDVAMTTLADQYHCVYSRYADDLVFSTVQPRVLEQVLKNVREYVRQQTAPRLKINEGKVRLTSKNRRVQITGLVINDLHHVSVGRSIKRKIKALVHRFRQNTLAAEELSYLTGYLAFVRSVEPTFLRSLEMKYGHDVIGAISGTRAVRLKIYETPRRRRRRGRRGLLP